MKFLLQASKQSIVLVLSSANDQHITSHRSHRITAVWISIYNILVNVSEDAADVDLARHGTS